MTIKNKSKSKPQVQIDFLGSSHCNLCPNILDLATNGYNLATNYKQQIKYNYNKNVQYTTVFNYFNSVPI